MPLRNVCSQMRAMAEPDELDEARRLYAIAWRPEIASGTDQVGSVQAISAETGQVVWNYQQRAATMAPAATGGGLVFGGDGNGRFRAFVERTGEILWEATSNRPSPGSRLPTRSTAGSTSRGVPASAAFPGADAGAASEHWEQPRRLRPAVTPCHGTACTSSFSLPEPEAGSRSPERASRHSPTAGFPARAVTCWSTSPASRACPPLPTLPSAC